jgi:hypothetical protein
MRGIYHWHYDPVNLPQDDLSLCIQLFSRVLPDFEVEVCANIAHLFFCRHVTFVHAGVADWADVRLLFRHSDLIVSTVLLSR